MIVCEVERRQDNDWNEVIDAIRRDVTAEHELPPDAVILVRSGSIPKTSSGKIQRHACRQELPGRLTQRSLHDVALWKHRRRQTLDSAKRKATVTAASPRRRMPRSCGSSCSTSKRLARNASAICNRTRTLSSWDSIRSSGWKSSTRLEETFGGQLPEEVLPEIETCQEVADAVIKHLGTSDRRQSGPSPLRADSAESITASSRCPSIMQLQRNMALLQETGTAESVLSSARIGDARYDRHRRPELINFSSYNYLGMSGDPVVVQAAKEAIDQLRHKRLGQPTGLRRKTDSRAAGTGDRRFHRRRGLRSSTSAAIRPTNRRSAICSARAI